MYSETFIEAGQLGLACLKSFYTILGNLEPTRIWIKAAFFWRVPHLHILILNRGTCMSRIPVHVIFTGLHLVVWIFGGFRWLALLLFFSVSYGSLLLLDDRLRTANICWSARTVGR